MVGLHWITGCVESDVATLGGVLPGLRCVDESGKYGHPMVMQDERGVRLYHGSDRPGQPLVLVADGETCERCGPEVLGTIEELEGWATRTDLQRDVGPDEAAPLRLREMYQAVNEKRLQGPFRSHQWFAAHNTQTPGQTLYLGSRQGRRVLRCYDRRGPLRLEFEFHHDRRSGRHPLKLLQTPEGRERAWAGSLALYEWPGVKWWNDLQGDPFAWPAEDVVKLSPLEQAVQDFREQHGANLWAMFALGVTAADLVKVPEKPSTHQRRRWSKWVQSQGESGRASQAGRLLEGRRATA